MRGTFLSPHHVADPDAALDSLADQIASGYRTFCVKLSMFIDDLRGVAAISERVVSRLGEWD